jgi:hypothetical protein
MGTRKISGISLVMNIRMRLAMETGTVTNAAKNIIETYVSE